MQPTLEHFKRSYTAALPITKVVVEWYGYEYVTHFYGEKELVYYSFGVGWAGKQCTTLLDALRMINFVQPDIDCAVEDVIQGKSLPEGFSLDEGRIEFIPGSYTYYPNRAQ